MFSRRRRKRAARKVEPGDGRPLKRFRWWQPLSRSLFGIRLVDEHGCAATWSVDVGLWGDSSGEMRARLYRDGREVARSTLPTAFEVPGGVIEVVASAYGLKRCHHVKADGAEVQLSPDPASAEGRRARMQETHPVASRAIGFVSISILVVALLLGIPQIVEQITHIPPVADAVGTFTSPVHLPAWLNISLVFAAMLASTERALRLRNNWLLDGGLLGGES